MLNFPIGTGGSGCTKVGGRQLQMRLRCKPNQNFPAPAQVTNAFIYEAATCLYQIDAFSYQGCPTRACCAAPRVHRVRLFKQPSLLGEWRVWI